MITSKKRRGRPPGSKNKKNEISDPRVSNKGEVKSDKNNEQGSLELKIKKIDIPSQTKSTLTTPEKKETIIDNNTPDEDGVITFGKNKDIGIVYDKYCIIVKQKKFKKDDGSSYWVDAPSPFHRDLESAVNRIAEIYKRDKLRKAKDFDELVEKYAKIHSEFMRDLKEYTKLFKGVRKSAQVQDE